MKGCFWILILVFCARVTLQCPNDPLCQQCDGSVCIYCVYSYPNDHGVCVPYAGIPGCYGYFNQTLCIDCDLRYFRTPESRCLPMSEAAWDTCYASYTSFDHCDACFGGVLPINGSCDRGVPCNDTNCLACIIDAKMNSERCIECQEGYTLWADPSAIGVACFKSGFLKGCFSTQNYLLCNNCNLGYYNRNGRCMENQYLVSETGYGEAFELVGFQVTWILVVGLIFVWP